MNFNLGLGLRYTTPSKAYMEQDMRMMNQVFPPGVVINMDNIPDSISAPLAALIQAGGRGVLDLFKTQFNVLNKEIDALLKVVEYNYAIYKNDVQTRVYKEILKAQNEVIKGLRKETKKVTDQIGEALVNNSKSNINYILASSFRTSIPITALVNSLEERVNKPFRFARYYYMKLTGYYTGLAEYKLILTWLRARQTYYRMWVQAIDVSIIRTKTSVGG